MPITERRLRLSRHVHAPYTTKGKERCTSTSTPGRVFGILFSLARCYPSGCASCSASLVIYLIEAVCVTAYYLGALFKTGINTAAVIALMGSKKHLTIWRDNARKNFCIAWRDECFFLIPQCLSPWLKEPKMAQTSSAACLNGAVFGSLFLKKVSRLTSAVSRYCKTDFFFFLLWGKQIRGLYSQNTCKIKRLLVLQGCSGAASCHSPWS